MGAAGHISIHTFLAEGDLLKQYVYSYITISIHTFLAEGDGYEGRKEKYEDYFNPHLPCGR